MKIKTNVKNPRTPPGTPPAGYRFLVEGEKVRPNDQHVEFGKFYDSDGFVGQRVGTMGGDLTHCPWVRKVFVAPQAPIVPAGYRLMRDDEKPGLGDLTWTASKVWESVFGARVTTVAAVKEVLARLGGENIYYATKIEVAKPVQTVPNFPAPAGYEWLKVGETVTKDTRLLDPKGRLCTAFNDEGKVSQRTPRLTSVTLDDVARPDRPQGDAYFYARKIEENAQPVPAAPIMPGYRLLRDDEVPTKGDYVHDASVCPEWRLVSCQLDATVRVLTMQWPGVRYARKVEAPAPAPVPAPAPRKPLLPGMVFTHDTAIGGVLTVRSIPAFIEGKHRDTVGVGIQIKVRPPGIVDSTSIALTEDTARTLLSDLQILLK
jgi:hypothetical protein